MLRALALALLLTGCATAQMRSACLGAGAADAATTAVGISNGAREANPLLKPAPVALSLAAVAVTVLAADNLLKSGHERAARWLYGACALLHGGAAGWNGKELAR